MDFCCKSYSIRQQYDLSTLCLCTNCTFFLFSSSNNKCGQVVYNNFRKVPLTNDFDKTKSLSLTRVSIIICNNAGHKLLLKNILKINFMRKHAFLLFLLSLGIQFCVTAQLFVADLPPGYNKVVSAEKEKGLDGSPWLTETWVPGSVVTMGGENINGLNYRYNVYRNRLYFQYENAEYVISSPDSIKQLKMDDKT